MNRLIEQNFQPSPGFDIAPRSINDASRHRPGHEPANGKPAAAWVRPNQTPFVALTRLRGVLLLGGSVGTSQFRSSIRRSIIGLPIEDNQTLLTHWREHCGELAKTLNQEGLPVRLILDQTAHMPEPVALSHEPIQLSVERDPVEFRGTGGLLRDLAQGYHDDDYLLVATAVQLLQIPLPVITAELANQLAPVVVVSHSDGTPSGIMLLRCNCLRDLPLVGFVDMKEQGLGIIARRHTVKVLQRAHPTGLPIRTHISYLSAIRQYHQDRVSTSNCGAPSPKLEDWERAFAIVEEGAVVSPSAKIHDSVILKGGRVEADAVVVNSVVCDGGVVKRGQVVADELIKSGGR